MTDFAKLKLVADSGELVVAADDLDDLSKSAEKAEVKSGLLSKGMKKAALAAGAFALSLVSVNAALSSAAQAREFSGAIAEVSTLIEGTPAQLDQLSGSARAMAGTFGGTASQQVAAFYQAISAGAGSVSDASVLLDSANRLAIGGVTDVTTAVDALTTATNAYAVSNLTAADASDIMFVGIKGGKTTAAELSAALGNVVPIASSLGVSFSEIVAGTAALTTQGQTTSVAVTGLRQVLAGIIKPTSEATKTAAALGLEFDTSALKSKGLSGFLEDVIDKTGGSKVALGQLFGSVEALNAVLSFAGGGGEAFTKILSDMENRVGATDRAFTKIADSMNQRYNVAISRMGDASLTVGNALLESLVPSLEVAASVIEVASQNLGLFAALSAGAATSTFVALIGSLTAATTATGLLTAALGALRVAVGLVGGPWGILAGLVASTASYFLVFRDNAGHAQTAAEGVAKAEDELNRVLGVFTSTAAADAGKQAIKLANDRVKQAEATFSAADAELALLRASIAVNEGNRTGFTKFAADNEARRLQEDMAELLPIVTKAENDLAAARSRQRQVVSTVTGANYDLSSAITETETAVIDLTETTDESSRSMADVFVEATENLNFQRDLIGRTAREVEIMNGQEQLRKQLISASTEEMKTNSTVVLKLIAQQTKAYGEAVGKVFDLKKIESDRVAEMEAQAQEVSRLSNTLTTSLETAFTSFVESGFTSFKSFAKNILGSFKTLLAQMVATALKNKIIIGVSTAVGGTAGAASAAGAAVGGPAGALTNLLTPLLGAGGLGSAFTGGLTSVIGGLGSGGLAGGVGAISSALGGATASFAGLASAAGAVALPLAAAFVAFKFFSTKTKELDRGLLITADNTGALVEQFRVLKKIKFFGASKKVRERVEDAGDEISSPIVNAVSDIQAEIISTAALLNVGESAFRDFSTQIKIATKDLSDAQIQEKLLEAFKELGDEFAALVPGLSALSLEGEGANDTLKRVSTNLATVNGAFDLLGIGLREFSVTGAEQASSIVEAAGGLASFSSGISFFTQNVLSESKQIEIATNIVEKTFASIGRAVPETMADFEQAFRNLAANGDATAATLLAVAPTFKTVMDAASAASAAASAAASETASERLSLEGQLLTLQGNTAELRRRELEALDPANRSLKEMIFGLQDAKDALDSLDPQDFATRFDLRRARAGVANSDRQPLTGLFSPTQLQPVSTDSATVAELKTLRDEVSKLRNEQLQLSLKTESNTRKTANVLVKFDVDGLPSERAS